MSRRQANRWSKQDEQEYYAQQGQAAQAAPAPAPAPVAAAPQRDSIQQLKDLADLKAQGVLTDAEFAAEKAKILA